MPYLRYLKPDPDDTHECEPPSQQKPYNPGPNNLPEDWGRPYCPTGGLGSLWYCPDCKKVWEVVKNPVAPNTAPPVWKYRLGMTLWRKIFRED